jgi:hypothetical protein
MLNEKIVVAWFREILVARITTRIAGAIEPEAFRHDVFGRLSGTTQRNPASFLSN